ncbi:hypothetical protein SAMN04488490_3652 [Marinobacter sp. LV10R510-11A]|nr:hypothetical protein SAMN04488490_3652 [Marinobacter sp. LV10R510-11A]
MDQAEYWYAVASVLLFFKMFTISAYQGFHRIGKVTFKTPEDAAFVGRDSALANGCVCSRGNVHVHHERSDSRCATLTIALNSLWPVGPRPDMLTHAA